MPFILYNDNLGAKPISTCTRFCSSVTSYNLVLTFEHGSNKILNTSLYWCTGSLSD